MNQIVTSWLDTQAPSYQVKIDRGTWVDAARQGRKVPYKLYTPITDDPEASFPVILWSHGLGGGRDGAGFISRAVCAHGYVVAHIQHEGTDTSLWEGKPGHPWDVIRSTHIPRKATTQRLRDVPFALSQLDALARENTLLDMSRIGMSGHSFGAMTTQVMAGQTRGHGKYAYRLREGRFSAGIAYSPVPVRQKHSSASPAHYYGTIEMPLFIMTGTADDSPLEGFGYEHRLEVPEHAGGPEQSLLILNDGDHMVYNGSRGKLEDNPKRSVHENIIVTATLAFWDAYLKQDKKAKRWLTEGGFASYLDGEGEYRFRLQKELA